MNFFLRMLAPAILSVWPAADSLGAPADTLRISREKCIEIALNDNPSVKVADLEVKKTDYARKELEGSLFPSIDFSLAYQRSIELQSMNMNMG